ALATGKTALTWASRYDTFGRLRIVVEPSAAVGQETGETLRAGYGYDVAGRLVRVDTVDGFHGITQTRDFEFDNRGFLLSESHPELGTGSAPGVNTYGGYDVFGNPSQVNNPDRVTNFVYDPFGRLTQVRDGLNQNRIVKSFSYDSAPGRGKGKV